MKLQASAANSFVEQSELALPSVSSSAKGDKEKGSRAGKNQWNAHLYSSSSEYYGDEYESEEDTKSSGAAAADHNKVNSSAAHSQRYEN